MRIIWFVLFLGIYGLLSFLLGWSIKTWLAALDAFRWEPLYWAVFVAVAASPVIGRLHRFLRPFTVVGNVYFFVFEYGLLFSLAGALLVRLTALGAGTAGSAAALLLAVLAAVGFRNAHSPVKRRLVLHVDKPGRKGKLRIALASDFHLGVMSSRRHLRKFVDGVNAAKPDLVLLAGDIVDDDAHWFVRRKMGDILGRLEARHGVYGILGNHEYYGGQIPAVTEELAKAGIRVLRDETVLVDGWIRLTGREDVTNKNRKTLADLKREAGLSENPASPPLWIVMNHTPDDLKTPAEAGVDLHVSGHTHRGQLWPNHWLTRRIFELDYGYRKKNGMHAVVSSGYGFWGPPFRTNSRSEWWDIVLVFVPGEAASAAGPAGRTAGGFSGGLADAKRKAVVAGATGLVGMELVRQLLEDDAYESVTALVRRQTGLAHPKLKEVFVDYRNLANVCREMAEEAWIPAADRVVREEAHVSQLPDLAGADVFCALGTTIRKAGSQAAFREVDVEYPLALGRLALAQGAASFLIVTSLGANPASPIFYSRAKGDVEDALRELPLPALHLFRPSLLLGKREEFRLGEWLAAKILPGLSPLLGNYRPVHARTVAAAMIRAAKSGERGIHVHESRQIREMGKAGS